MRSNKVIFNTFPGCEFPQGSLTTSYSTVSYFKDIDTLKELDESGLHIGTSSGSLSKLLGDQEDESAVVKSLRKKFHLFNTSDPVIDRTASKRDICCVERKTDISIIITVSLSETVRAFESY